MFKPLRFFIAYTPEDLAKFITHFRIYQCDLVFLEASGLLLHTVEHFRTI